MYTSDGRGYMCNAENEARIDLIESERRHSTEIDRRVMLTHVGTVSALMSSLVAAILFTPEEDVRVIVETRSNAVKIEKNIVMPLIATDFLVF